MIKLKQIERLLTNGVQRYIKDISSLCNLWQPHKTLPDPCIVWLSYKAKQVIMFVSMTFRLNVTIAAGCKMILYNNDTTIMYKVSNNKTTIVLVVFCGGVLHWLAPDSNPGTGLAKHSVYELPFIPAVCWDGHILMYSQSTGPWVNPSPQ